MSWNRWSHLRHSAHDAHRARRKRDHQRDDRMLADRADLIAYLQRVSRSACHWVAFNPIEQYAIIQPINLTIECLAAA